MAARRSSSVPATEVPPNFITTIPSACGALIRRLRISEGPLATGKPRSRCQRLRFVMDVTHAGYIALIYLCHGAERNREGDSRNAGGPPAVGLRDQDPGRQLGPLLLGGELWADLSRAEAHEERRADHGGRRLQRCPAAHRLQADRQGQA